MRTVLLVAVITLVGGVVGCSSSSSTQPGDGAKTPPPQNSGAYNEKAPKGPRIPPPKP